MIIRCFQKQPEQPDAESCTCLRDTASDTVILSAAGCLTGAAFSLPLFALELPAAIPACLFFSTIGCIGGFETGLPLESVYRLLQCCGFFKNNIPIIPIGGSNAAFFRCFSEQSLRVFPESVIPTVNSEGMPPVTEVNLGRLRK